MNKYTKQDIIDFIEEHEECKETRQSILISPLPSLGDKSINDYLEEAHDEYVFHDVMGMLRRMYK